MDMDSNVTRPGRKTCEQAGYRTSNLLKGPYRPESQQANGRSLEFFGTPHQAGAPAVRDDLQNRAIHASDRHSNVPSPLEPKPARPHQSLTRVAETW
jgi:hypothetical protein